MKSNSIILLASAIVWLVGCSGFDSNQMLIHPEAVKPSATFDVAMVNVYTLLSMGTTITKKVERDSLHVLVGLPESWEVESAMMTIAEGMTTTQLLGLQTLVGDEKGLAAMIAPYLTKTVALKADAGVAPALKGDTVIAHDKTGKINVRLSTDNVKNWKGFSAPVNIVFEAGSEPDTTLPIDSMIALGKRMGMVDSATAKTAESLKSNFPTNGISMVPVVIALKVRTGTLEGNDTLYYFSKTATMTPPPASVLGASPAQKAQITELESGDMTFVPLTVSNNVAVITQKARTDAAGFAAKADRHTGNVRITLGSGNKAAPSVSIYSLQGTGIVSLPTKGTTALTWNGADTRGTKVRPGIYVIRAGAHTATVNIVR